MSELSKEQNVRAIKPETTAEERTWAALAHASTLFTLLIGFPTGGLGGLLLVFVPFLIYLSYKDKSRYVAYHAAQAFTIQIVGTVGFFVAFLVGVLVIVLIWVINVLLIFILVGLILIPISILITLAVVIVWLALPFVLGGFSVVATVETANGREYAYPYLGQWISDWLASHENGSSEAA